eukprot:1727251-Lingulodinium_polyedra.AAC.1
MLRTPSWSTTTANAPNVARSSLSPRPPRFWSAVAPLCSDHCVLEGIALLETMGVMLCALTCLETVSRALNNGSDALLLDDSGSDALLPG